MQSASDTPSSHSRRVGAQPKRGLWPLLVAERRAGAGRTGAQSVVALRESRRRGIDPPGITSADATLLAAPRPRRPADVIGNPPDRSGLLRPLLGSFSKPLSHSIARLIAQ